MVETLEVLADSKLGVSQQRVLPVKEANSILGCITMCIASRLRKVMISLSTHWITSRYCIQLWALQYGNVLDLLEQVQQRSPRWSGGRSTCPVRRGWGNGACSTWRREGIRGRGAGADLRPASEHLQGGYQDKGARLCTMGRGGRAKDNRHKLQHERFKLDVRKDIFMVRTVRQWSESPGRLCSLHP